MVSNRHGFMLLKPHRKRYGFKAFKRCQSHPFQVLTLYRSCSQALIILRPSEILRQNSDCIHIDAVSPFTRQMKPYHFENAPLLSAFSNRSGFGNGLDQHRVNRRCNRIESDAVTNETAFVLTLPKLIDFLKVCFHGSSVRRKMDISHVQRAIFYPTGF